MTSITRRRLLVFAAAAVLVALLVVTLQAALAAARTYTTPSGATDGQPWPWGSAFGTAPVGVPADSYHIAANHWNPASNGSMIMNLDDASTTIAFDVDGWTDVPNGNILNWNASASVVHLDTSTNTWVWSDVEGQSDETSGHFHAPAAYPDAYSGCHWGQCTFDGTDYGAQNAGVPYPIQASTIKNLMSTFNIAVADDAAGTGAAWNAAFDIWLDSGSRVIESGWMHTTNWSTVPPTETEVYKDYVGQPILPGYPGSLLQYDQGDQRGQNDGAEVMIWMNYRGYNNNPIRPAGTQLTDGSGAPIRVNLAGGTWDVWAARLGASGYPNWNVISYVRVNGDGTNPDVRSMANFDANQFIQDAMTRDCPTASGGVPVAGNKCASPNWWLTSVQTGFEIWAKGNGLSLTSFSVKPNTDVQVDTGRVDGAGTPQIFWGQKFLIRYKDTCGATTVGYTIADNLADTLDVTGSMVEVVPAVEAGVDMWAARVGPIYPNHENATITITPNCGAPTTIPVFIDPSGIVVNTKGELIEGADVTLMYAPGVASSNPEPAAGSFTTVPDQNAGLPSPIMCPPGDPSGCYGNIDNPDQTDANGFYRWDVADGWYKVQASKSGCTSAESIALPVSEGNPATNVNLVLDCGDVPPDDVSVVMTPMSDWNTGYCRNVIVTNHSSAPVDWKVTFTLVDGGTINNFWNVIWSQNGNQVTAEGVDWNNILQPGQSSHSLGFCAAK